MTFSSTDSMGGVLRGVLTIQCAALLEGVSGSKCEAAVRFAGKALSCSVVHDFESYNLGRSSPRYFLPIRHHSYMIQGIILQSTGRAIGEYQRIGIFESRPVLSKSRQQKETAECNRLLLEPQNFVYSKQDREMLFASSKSETGPHIITLV
jgi:hypothetical protein